MLVDLEKTISSEDYVETSVMIMLHVLIKIPPTVNGLDQHLQMILLMIVNLVVVLS